jgi:alanine racemase
MPGTRALTRTDRVSAVVDLDAVAANTRLIRETAGTPVMAVVKADGFGHGLLPVARAALDGGATWLGVTTLDEALELRHAGVPAPVLSWLHLPDEDFGTAIGEGVDLGVSSVEHLRSIVAAAGEAPARVHLKIDTGLSRNGAVTESWGELVDEAWRYEMAGAVHVRGVWSHLHTAEEPETVPEQVRRFEMALARANRAGLRPTVRHLANSAAALTLPATRYDLVRAGIALYGVEPAHPGLRPAMTLRARAVQVKRVPAGTGVSYGHDHVTARATTLVLVPLGFADGVPRLAGAHGAQVWFHGTCHPVVGRIAMDQFVVDVGDTPAHVGDEIVLFGPGDEGEPTAVDWARWAGTNPHEILTGIGPRVPRHHHRSEGALP